MKFIVEEGKTHTVLPKVMRAAVKLFVGKGIDGTTIKDIAAKSGVSEGALYRHFKSKEELAYHIFTTNVNAFSHELTALVTRRRPGRDQIHAYIAAAFDAYESERDLFNYLILSEHRELDKFPLSFKHPGHVALDVVREGQKAGLFRLMDPYLASSILVGSVIRICLVRFRDGIKRDLRGDADTVTDAIWRALKK